MRVNKQSTHTLEHQEGISEITESQFIPAPHALSDLRVVDMSTGIAGAFCSKLFADFGADVIKVEPPSGDPTRSLGPFPGGSSDLEASGMFIYLNSNKRGATLDLESERGRSLAADLMAKTDIVVVSFAPGEIESMGLGYDAIQKTNPAVIMISITPFGQTGPWRDWQATELVEYAAAGLSYVNGSPDREPLKEPGFESSYQAGACGFLGAMTALAHRDFTGHGQQVEISIQEAAAATFAPQFLGAMHSGESPGRGSTPLLPCKDGYVSLNVRHDATWEYMWLFFDAPEIAQDTRFATAAERRRRADELEELLLPYLAKYTMEELFHGLAPLRLLIGMTMDVERLVDDPHLRERSFFASSPHSTSGEIVIPGAPFRMSETPWSFDCPAPTIGQHNDEVFMSEIELGADELARLREEGVV
ncbi:MAG: CoA transferase [Dehalococcoidia bacterium]|nr:CoA transferase [Dehalococcoidia bacterium]